jgi:hypothetical protein
MHWT